MKFSRVKNTYLSRCKNLIYSDGYLVGFTGRQILLFDGELDLIRSRDGFSYAYEGEISPKKDKILTVSNENKFYVNAFPSLEPIGKASVKAPYNYGLYGLGCFAFDGNRILVAAMNGKTLNSVLHVCNADDFSDFSDHLAEKYWIEDLRAVPSLKKYYLIGLNRAEQKDYLIWFDGEKFEEFALEDFDDTISRSNFDEKRGLIEIYTFETAYFYDPRGALIKTKSLITDKNFETSFSDAIVGAFDDEEKKSEIKALSAALGMENIVLPDCVRDIAFGGRGVAYIATDCRLIAFDINSGKIVDEVNLGFGIEKIRLISDQKILVSTVNGASLFELRD